MILVQNLVKRYPGEKEDTLKRISFSLPDTGLVFLTGKSGCGKSTLLNLLSSIDEEYSGSIQVDGKELNERTEQEKAEYRFKTVSVAFQSFHATEEESVYTNRLKPLAIRKRTESEKKEKIDDVLKKVGLSNKKERKFKDLSGGEKKRISLAISILKDTPILFADEPLASLNKDIRKQITDLLLSLSHSRLVFVITHEAEEIPEGVFHYHRERGKRKLVKEGLKGRKRDFQVERGKYQGYPLFYQIIQLRKAKKSFFLRARMTFVIGLFSVSFSFQLSRNVSSSLISSMESYREDDSMVIESEESGISGTSFQLAGRNALNLYVRNHPKDILSRGYFFPESRNNRFGPNQSAQLHYSFKTRDMPKISFDALLNSVQIQEIPDTIYYGEAPREHEEILLGLEEDTLLQLSYFILEDKVSKLTEDDLETRGNECAKGKITLERNATEDNWKYSFRQIFKIKGFFESEVPLIVSSGFEFPLWLIQEQRGFLIYEKEEDRNREKPWSRLRQTGLKLYPEKAKEFLKSFLLDKERNQFIPELFKTPYYYKNEDPKTHNHILLYQDILPKISVPDIERFVLSSSELFSSVSYSSSVYTYTASGYISGFAKPFFFSRYKEKLNEIEDNYASTEENLGQFQSTLREVPNEVRKADLVSSRNGEGLRFVSLNQSNPKIKYGYAPSSVDEIGISSGMAEKLFSSSRSALDKQLNTLTLIKTLRKGSKYQNQFEQGVLKISAIYEDDGIKIYQDSLFPLCYCFVLGSLEKEECRINQAVVKADLNKKTPDYYLSLIRKYGSFHGSFPMLARITEIKNRLKTLSYLFLSFSALSLLSAFTLLSLSRYLRIKKEQKEIGISLSFGYTKKEISYFYFCFSILIGLLSYFFSFLLSLFTQKSIEKALLETRSSSKRRMEPFLISFLLGLSIILCVFALVYLLISSFSPKDAFSRR